MAHGKRHAHYKLREGKAGSAYVSRPLNFESLDLNGKSRDEYLSDMARIWRLSGVGHSDLILIERIRQKPPKGEALYAICLVIVLHGLEEAIATTVKGMGRVAEYVRQHSDLVRRIQQQRRYSRLKTVEARARLLALGLANPAICLTYAERAKANRREFSRDDRLIHHTVTKTKHHRFNRCGD